MEKVIKLGILLGALYLHCEKKILKVNWEIHIENQCEILEVGKLS